MIPLPNIRTNIITGDRALEVCCIGDSRHVTDLRAVLGVHRGVDGLAVLETYNYMIPTRHKYQELVDLLYPNY